mgnify:CR=1 FL=1
MSKTALITGSTSGIGLEIARCFARAGYKLIMNGLEENGPEIAKAIEKEFRTTVLFSSANMLFPEQIDEMVKGALQQLNTIDVLINNAGIQHVSPVEDFPIEKWNQIISINLTSAFLTTRLVWNQMKSQKFGRIINIASAHGLVASEFKSAYVAAKHGIVGFTKTIALEGAPYNITANALCPGYVKTPLVEKQIKDQARAHQISEREVENKIMLHKQAVKEFIPADLIANMCIMLSDEKSGTITGTAIPIDGGWNAQ